MGGWGEFFFLSLYCRCFLVSHYTLDAVHPMLRATLWQTRNYNKIYAYKNARKFPETVRSTEGRKKEKRKRKKDTDLIRYSSAQYILLGFTCLCN